ncbi:MAG: DUF3299 domain-containing protein [Phycisphaerales bacterium]|nr:DUF3299 domain-containing protein [Phycisphaerales bacterium]
MNTTRQTVRDDRMPGHRRRYAGALRGALIALTFVALGVGALFVFSPRSRPKSATPENVQGAPLRTDPVAPVPGGKSTTSPATTQSSPRPIISASIPGMMPIVVDPSKLATIGQDVDDDGTIHLSIDQLACYPYDLLAMNEWLHDPESGPRPEQIPEQIRKLNGKRVELRGYMMPVTMYEEGTPMFLLLRDALACCFGMAHGMNAWVRVEMKNDERVAYVSGTPIVVRGILEVGEQVEDDLVMSIYRLRGERVRRLDGY